MGMGMGTGVVALVALVQPAADASTSLRPLHAWRVVGSVPASMAGAVGVPSSSVFSRRHRAVGRGASLLRSHRCTRADYVFFIIDPRFHQN